MTQYVNSNYPNVNIQQIERDRVDYELRLSNRLELTFDTKFNIIDIDD
ncbi:MAG: PepSY-like domain-containing protein [Bacteroidaceae bacterium]|nr:PepSY-like domain-containing protein [Bacteroidaceae bacterium]